MKQIDDGNDTPIARLVNAILLTAAKKQPTHVRVECATAAAPSRVLFRLDGVFGQEMAVPAKLFVPLVRRLETMCEIGSWRRRWPYAGGVTLSHDSGPTTFRMRFRPTVAGMRVVLRLAPSGPPLAPTGADASPARERRAAAMNRASAAMNRHDYQEAVTHLRAALRDAEANSETADSLCELAAGVAAAGDPSEASTLVTRARALYEQVFGTSAPAVAHASSQLSSLAYDLGRRDEAERAATRAYDILAAAFGPLDCDTAEACSWLGWLQHERGELDAALALQLQARRDLLACVGADDAEGVLMLRRLAESALASGRKGEAASAAREALGLAQALLDGDDPALVRCREVALAV